MNKFLLIFVIAAVYYSRVNSEETTPPLTENKDPTTTDPTTTSTCDAKALPENQDKLQSADTIFYVGYVMVLQAPTTTSSYCSPFNFKPDACGAIQMEIIRSDDGSRAVKTVSLEKSGGGATCIHQSYKVSQDGTLTFKSDSVTKYGKIGSDKKLIEEDVPTDLKTMMERDLMMMAIGENAEWCLFATCKKEVSFVAYSATTVKENKVQDYIDAVKTAVQNASLDFTTFVEVDTNISDDSVVSACLSSSETQADPTETTPTEVPEN